MSYCILKITKRREKRIDSDICSETGCSLSSGAAGSGQMDGAYCTLMKVTEYQSSCGRKRRVV